MLIQPYQLSELQFAYCYRVYYRWRTHYARPHSPLANLTAELLNDRVAPYNIHVLECSSSTTDVMTLVSLRPEETVSAAASKLKGQVSKWLREQLKLQNPASLLSKGYFACTVGDSASQAVDQYLDKQGDHHGYSARARPPLFVRSFEPAAHEEARLQAKHAHTLLRFHLVLATWRRKGVFGAEAAEAVTEQWHGLQHPSPASLLKVSFVPDHVHVALQVHPSASPAEIVGRLKNAAQEVLWKQFADSVIRSGVERLWQPSAYIGSYGDLVTPKIRNYIRNWESEARE
jgi:putative transposase